MDLFDDFLMPQNFEAMAREYELKKMSGVLGVQNAQNDKNDVSNLFGKIEFLRVLVGDLKSKTQNREVLLVLDDISSQISTQNSLLLSVLTDYSKVQQTAEEMAKMFCNNLKIAISTASDIVRFIIKLKDADKTFSIAPKLTESVNAFLDINNQLVSLFGECRYLKY